MISTFPNDCFSGQTPRFAIEEVLRNPDTKLFSIDMKGPLAIPRDRFRSLPGRIVVDVYDFISFAESFDGERLPFIFEKKDADIRLLKICVEYRKKVFGLQPLSAAKLQDEPEEDGDSED